MIELLRAPFSLPAAAGLFLSTIGFSIADAQFTLLEEQKGRDSYTAVVHFAPEWELAEAAAADRRIDIPEDFEFPELLSDLAPERDVRDFATSSFLLGLPGHRELALEEWSVEPLSATLPDGTTLGEFDSGSSVTILNGTVGTVRGLQIVVDPTVALDGVRPAGLTLRVTGPGEGGLAKAATRRLDEKDTRAVTSLFLNTVTHGEVPSSLIDPAAKDTIPPLPMPPGEFRLGYHDGERVFRLPLQELGLTAADVPNLTLKHHTELLPVDDFDPDDPEYEVHPIILSIGGNAADGFWFYAPRRNTLSDRSDSVFVSLSHDTKSPLIQSRAAFPGGTGLTPPSAEQPVWRESLHEFRDAYQRAAPRPLGRRFVAGTVREGQNLTVDLPLHGELTDLNVELTPFVHGVTATPLNPDHYADFTLGGVPIPRTTWDGRTGHTPTFSVQLAGPPTGGILPLRHAIPTGTPVITGGYADIQVLGEAQLRYQSLPRAETPGYLLELPGDEAATTRLLTVGGFPAGTNPADLVVLDVSVPRAPVQLSAPHVFTGSDGSAAVAFVTLAGGSRYFVALRGQLSGPDSAGESELLPPLPPGETLRTVFVREPSIAAALAPLVARHAPGAMEFTPQAAFNAFNGGQDSPEAIREALAYYILNAPARLPMPHVILVGHGTLDRRNYFGKHSGPIIPMFVEHSAPDSASITIETPVDMNYGRLQSNGILLDAIVARLPVRNASQLEVIIQRQQAYEEAAQGLSVKGRYGVFLSDYVSEVMADAALWPSIWQGTGQPSVRIDFALGSNGNAERAELAQAISDDQAGGAALVLYNGHGNNDRWGSNGNLMRTSHVSSFATAGRWPLFATFTCLSAYYASPLGDPPPSSMAESWIRTPVDGAIGIFSPATVDFYVEQKLLAVEVMELTASEPSERPDSWGEIFFTGVNTYLVRFPGLWPSSNNYHYFGDPSAHATLNMIQPDRDGNGWSVW